MYNSATLAETAFAAGAFPRAQAKPVKRMMTALTGAVTALGLMVASAAPAHADRASDNLAKVVVTAIAIGAIVNALDHENQPAAQPVRQPLPRPVPQPLPLPEPEHVRSPKVPAVCAIEFSGARRNVTVYPERCLRREGFEARLPRQCATEARVFGRNDRVYAEDCLRNTGYRIEGDRRHDWRDGPRDNRHDDWRNDRHDNRRFEGHDNRRRWPNTY
jgi:hypothetical protein